LFGRGALLQNPRHVKAEFSSRPKWLGACAALLCLLAPVLALRADPAPQPSWTHLVRSLAVAPPLEALAGGHDWLVEGSPRGPAVFRSEDGNQLILDNGLIRRTFQLGPNLATVGLDQIPASIAFLRSVEPEAILTLNGQKYPVGGLTGVPDRAFLLPEWLPTLAAIPGAFQLADIKLGNPEAPFGWKRKRNAPASPWPPEGVAVEFTLKATTPELQGVEVVLHYELYANVPIIGKWLRVLNRSNAELAIDSIDSERLALVEAESVVDERPAAEWLLPNIDLLSDHTFGGMDPVTANETLQWERDPAHTSQVSYTLQTPSILVSRPKQGPGAILKPGETFHSHRTHLVLHDSGERERRGLGLRKAFRTLTPWAMENPIMMHVSGSKSEPFRAAVDQCAEVGFEMIIYTFGSGLNMESKDPEYIARVKADVEYAHSKGIEVGAYSLLASRSVSPEDDAINPATGKPGGAIFGNSPCLASRWGLDYFDTIKSFMEQTGLDLLEHDGSYPGDPCASTTHPGHHGLADSQWAQWRLIADLYAWCRERGIFLNVPDFYFLAGSSKIAMGYRETNWSLPRERQIILGRQNIFDGTWAKTPSMGWMFVPLVEYHGGGAAATLEPLHDHIEAYESHLLNNLGAGVQACYRGPRLYDSPETKAMVVRWVEWFKKHRAILESDLIHVRRPTGADLDVALHVNPALPERAMAVVHNPTQTAIEREIELPLYYSGLRGQTLVQIEEGEPTLIPLTPDAKARVKVAIPAGRRTWIIAREAK